MVFNVIHSFNKYVSNALYDKMLSQMPAQARPLLPESLHSEGMGMSIPHGQTDTKAPGK